MNAKERAARDASALELRRAGVSAARIRDELQYSTLAQVEAGLQRAAKAAGVVSDPLAVRMLELDRLDRLQQAVWVKAVRGDVNAIDRVLKLSEARMRLAGVADEGIGRMAIAFEKSVAVLRVTDADAAIIAAGQRIAERIDQAFASGDPMAETKALYLVPHLMNVMRELGATGERGSVSPEESAVGAAANDLTAFKQKRGIA